MSRITAAFLIMVISLLCIPCLSGCGDSGSSAGDLGGGGGTSATTWKVDNLDDPGKPLRPGDWIKIESSRFGSSMNGSYVTFILEDGTTGEADLYEQWTDTEIVCRVPLDLFSKTKANTTVPSGYQEDTIVTLRGEADVTIHDTGERIRIAEGQELVISTGKNTNPSDRSPLPVVRRVTSAVAGQGSTVTMTGSKFTGLMRVVIKGSSSSDWKATSLSVIDDTTALFVVPRNVPAGTYGIIAENSVNSSSAPDMLIVVPAGTVPVYPVLSSITSAVEGQGSAITLTGQNFTGLRTVYILTTPPTTATGLAVTSDTTATCVVPPYVKAGNYKVLVTNETGTGEGAANLKVLASGLPTVESITPAVEGQATTVTMTGSKFTSLKNVTILTDPDVTATDLAIASDTAATFTVPGTIHAGTYSVSLTNVSGTAIGSDKLTVTEGPVPVVESITPAVEGQATTVTMTGQNLTGVTAVTILTATPTAAANLTLVSATSLTFTVPAGVPAGTYSVSATNFSGTGTGQNRLTVTASGGGGGGGVILVPTIGAYQYGTKWMTLDWKAPAKPRADVTVTNLLDDDSAGSLRKVVEAATDGDTVKFSVGGVITLNAAELAVTGKSLTIDASGAPSAVTVQAGGNFRIFSIDSGAGKTVTVKSLTMKGGDGSAAGGKFDGGSISVAAASALSLTDCTIEGSKALNGGGIFTAGTVTLTRCTISNNSSTSGGGIFIAGTGVIRLGNCTISGNNADAAGGGVTLNTSGAASITNSTISRNTAVADYGGGIACLEGAAYLLNTIVIDNTAPLGGDLYNKTMIICAYYCWYAAVSGTITTRTVAPDVTAGYVTGMLGDPALNTPGTTKTMEVMGSCPAINKGAFVYYNDDDGFYLQGSDGKYYTLEAFAAPVKAVPLTDRITTDQRGVARPQ
jgi:hypothetical protein